MDEIILNKLEQEDKKLASISKRILAYSIDCCLCYLILFLIMFFYIDKDSAQKISIAINEKDLETFYNFIIPFIKYYIFIKFVYVLVFFYMYGATLGNFITKTKIVNYEHFDKPNFIESFFRTCVFMLCDIILNGILFISIFLNKTHRHFADIVGKTVVIEVA